MSLTVTVKLQLAWLPEPSVVEQVTVVVPFGKAEPDAGLHVVDAGLPQLSPTVGANDTTAAHRFGSVDLTMFAGHVIEGPCVSFTVTVKLHEEEFPATSLTLQVTVVTPFAKEVPDAGLQTGVSGGTDPLLLGANPPGQLSVTIGAA